MRQSWRKSATTVSCPDVESAILAVDETAAGQGRSGNRRKPAETANRLAERGPARPLRQAGTRGLERSSRLKRKLETAANTRRSGVRASLRRSNRVVRKDAERLAKVSDCRLLSGKPGKGAAKTGESRRTQRTAWQSASPPDPCGRQERAAGKSRCNRERKLQVAPDPRRSEARTPLRRTSPMVRKETERLTSVSDCRVLSDPRIGRPCGGRNGRRARAQRKPA